MAAPGPRKPSKLARMARDVPWAIVPRKRLDVAAADLLYGIGKAITALPSHRAGVTNELQQLWTGEDTMVTLSVRTSLDLLLQALALPRGSEVLMSAVTIKDMVKLVEHHGLTPVPVDLDPATLAPRVDLMRAAITPRTKLFIVAHIFGTRFPMEELCEAAHEHGVLVVEDAAEAFVGLQYKGSDACDLNMFSFGTIKTATAMGGCITRVKDPELRREMCEINDSYPARSRAFYAGRLAKYLVAQSVLNPALFGAAVRAIKVAGGDVDAVITSMSRGFPGDDLVSLLRYRPSVPLLFVLKRVLEGFQPESVEARRIVSQRAVSMLRDVPGIQIPGLGNPLHSFWLFPVMVADPEHVCKQVSARGFDVTSGTTQLGPVDRYVNHQRPDSRKGSCDFARRLMTSVVYLPVTPDLSANQLERLVELVKEAVATTPRNSRL